MEYCKDENGMKYKKNRPLHSQKGAVLQVYTLLGKLVNISSVLKEKRIVDVYTSVE